MMGFSEFIEEGMLGYDGNNPEQGVGGAIVNDRLAAIRKMTERIKVHLVGPGNSLGFVPLAKVDPGTAKALADALKYFESALQDADA